MTARTGLAAGAAAALLAAGVTATAADLDFKPYAASQYSYDSNVYRFSRQVADVTGTGDTADRSVRNTAGIDSAYTWQRQSLQLMAEARQFEFDQFEHLDHDASTVAAVFDSGLLATTRAHLEFRDERRMASFEDRRTTQLIMERDQTARAGLIVGITPEWQVVTGATRRHLRSPLPDAPALPQPSPGAPARVASPDFAVHETGFSAGARYGIENKEHPEEEAPLLIGALLEHNTVSFSGATPQPQPPPGVTRETFDGYALLSLGGTANYALDGFSALDAKVGLTRFDPSQSTADAAYELTGEVGMVRKFSVISELSGHLFRRIVPIAANADSATETGLSVGARWEPIRDLTFLADYAYARSAARGMGFAAENQGRHDDVQSASLSAAYPKFKTLYLRVFAAYSDRRSSVGYNDFDDFVVGAELSAQWGGGAAAD